MSYFWNLVRNGTANGPLINGNVKCCFFHCLSTIRNSWNLSWNISTELSLLLSSLLSSKFWSSNAEFIVILYCKKLVPHSLNFKRSVEVGVNTHAFYSDGPEFDPQSTNTFQKFSKEMFFHMCRRYYRPQLSLLLRRRSIAKTTKEYTRRIANN